MPGSPARPWLARWGGCALSPEGALATKGRGGAPKLRRCCAALRLPLAARRPAAVNAPAAGDEKRQS
jgi:hypothetical protein